MLLKKEPNKREALSNRCDVLRFRRSDQKGDRNTLMYDSILYQQREQISRPNTSAAIWQKYLLDACHSLVGGVYAVDEVVVGLHLANSASEMLATIISMHGGYSLHMIPQAGMMCTMQLKKTHRPAVSCFVRTRSFLLFL